MLHLATVLLLTPAPHRGCLVQELQTQIGSAGSNREGYALAAGMALGLITLGRGHNMPALADLHLQDRLVYVAVNRLHGSRWQIVPSGWQCSAHQAGLLAACQACAMVPAHCPAMAKRWRQAAVATKPKSLTMACAALTSQGLSSEPDLTWVQVPDGGRQRSPLKCCCQGWPDPS